MIYQADWVLPLDAPPIPHGWIRVDGDCIAALGASADLPGDAEVRKFPGCALLPGFINAHCHLELSLLKDKLPRGLPFPAWVKALRETTAAYTSEDYRHAARLGVSQLLAGGTTTVVDVGNTGESLPALAESPLRAFGLIEVLGLDPEWAKEKLAAARVKIEAGTGRPPRLRAGVTAHSTYACSPALLAAAVAYQRAHHLPFTLHAAESREEQELFASGSGPLQEFCRTIYADATVHLNTTPLQYLESLHLPLENPLVVHANHLRDADIAWLSRHDATVVHCPSSHAFFGQVPFPFSRLRERGVPVCLGTDSLASGDSLSMLDQIRAFRHRYPEVTAKEALRMATTIPALALGWEDQIGKLKPGFKADFIVIKMAEDPYDFPYESVLFPGAETVFAAIDGKPGTISKPDFA